MTNIPGLSEDEQKAYDVHRVITAALWQQDEATTAYCMGKERKPSPSAEDVLNKIYKILGLQQ